MTADAPRFRALWQRAENRSVLTMAREAWGDVRASSSGPVRLDISETPLGGLASRVSIVASLAAQTSDVTGTIEIYRYDPNDYPTPINKDTYTVWTELGSHPQLEEWVSAASTAINDNFREFIRDNVFIVKDKPGKDHWLPNLPASVMTVIEST